MLRAKRRTTKAGSSSSSKQASTSRVFSIGYQGKSVSELCDRLSQAGVRTLVDVRAVAWSHRPEYRKTALAESLAAKDIRYVHYREAGNPFRSIAKRTGSFTACEKRYARYLSSHPEILEGIRALIGRDGVALLCYESDRDHCHRGALLRAVGRNRRLAIIDL